MKNKISQQVMDEDSVSDAIDCGIADFYLQNFKDISIEQFIKFYKLESSAIVQNAIKKALELKGFDPNNLIFL